MEVHHRYFIQYMLKNGVSTVSDALNFCKDVSKGKVANITQFKTLVIEINREISKQFFKIAFYVCEVTNENIVLWLNTKNDDIAKLQLNYSAIELEYFQALLQEIIHSEEHRLTFIICINITSTLTSQFSRDNGQKVLNKWIKGGYYIQHGDYIHLGARTILEFTAYLRSACPESLCNLCSELVFTGKKCSSCENILHSHCLSTYLSNQSVCPCCQNDWVETAEDHIIPNTMDNVSENEEPYSDELNSYSQSGSLSPVLATNRSTRGQKIRYSDEEPGPSNWKRQK